MGSTYDQIFLDKPNTKISWNKLSLCFCLRPRELKQQQRKHPQRKKQQQPSFLILRRHSSFSLPDVGLDDCFPTIPDHDDDEPPPPSFDQDDDRPRGCSVSDFTESETSSYFSFSDDDDEEEEALKQSKEGAPPPSRRDSRNINQDDSLLSTSRESESKAKNSSKAESADTSAAVLPRSAKPPILASRARSAGLLPPLNPNLMQQPSQDSSLVINRSRTDTGDFTRNSNFTRNSGTTTNSRHRRNHDHFSFCSASISDIYNKGSSTTNNKKQPPLPPPSVVSFQDRFHTSDDSEAAVVNGGALAKPSTLRLTDRGASDVSALGFGDSFESHHADETETTTQLYDDLLGLGYDEDVHDDNDDDSGSPFAALKKGLKDTPMTNVPSPLQENLVDVSKELEYLRKSPSLDDTAEGSLVISGWVAVLNLGTDTNAHQHHFYRIPPNHQFEADDIYYLRATKDSSGRAFVRLRPSNDSAEHKLMVERDWRIESREVNGRMGKAVVLRTAKVSLLLLPVSLSDLFFVQSGEFVCDSEFDACREELFVPPGQYAPDNQMDAAMYLMFTIDSLVKCGAF